MVPAKQIGLEHDIDCYTVMGMERPIYTVQPGYHKIKKFKDLQYAVNGIDYDEWEVFCRLLNVDESTVASMKNLYTWYIGAVERLEFCLHDYLKYGVAT